MKRICLDIETDGFDPSHIWCVGTEDVDTGETRLFLESDRLKFREFMRDVEEVWDLMFYSSICLFLIACGVCVYLWIRLQMCLFYVS